MIKFLIIGLIVILIVYYYKKSHFSATTTVVTKPKTIINWNTLILNNNYKLIPNKYLDSKGVPVVNSLGQLVDKKTNKTDSIFKAKSDLITQGNTSWELISYTYTSTGKTPKTHQITTSYTNIGRNGKPMKYWGLLKKPVTTNSTIVSKSNMDKRLIVAAKFKTNILKQAQERVDYFNNKITTLTNSKTQLTDSKKKLDDLEVKLNKELTTPVPSNVPAATASLITSSVKTLVDKRLVIVNSLQANIDRQISNNQIQIDRYTPLLTAAESRLKKITG